MARGEEDGTSAAASWDARRYALHQEPGMSLPLIETKLFLPSPRPGLVPRPRLRERLDRGLGAKLMLVSAPAGFGKTTLLVDWLASVTASAAAPLPRPGWPWTRRTTTRHGSGATWWPRCARRCRASGGRDSRCCRTRSHHPWRWR